MPEALEYLTAYNSEAEAGEAASAGAAEKAPAKAEAKAENLKVRDGAEAVKQNGGKVPSISSGPAPKLPKAGPIGGLLLVILFVVFAIMPAYPGSGASRLQLLWAALVRGGSLRGDEAGSASPMSGSGANGDAYHQVNPFDSGVSSGEFSSFWASQPIVP